jgi:GT2 family glycosyltransferase
MAVPSTSRFQLSIIIVNHLSDDVLPQCLESITQSKPVIESEVIIVDNPASYTELGLKDKYSFSLKNISTARRVGFAEASNLGAAAAQGYYLLFLNPDISLKADAIYALINVLKSDPKIGLAAGRLTYPDGRFQPSCRRFPNLKNLLFSRGSVLGRLFQNGNGEYTLPDYSDPTAVDSAAAAMIMTTRELFEDLGGFDERFPLYMEDTDLCYRIYQKGKEVFYVPQAGAAHLWGHATRHYRFRRIIWHHISAWRYFVKHHLSLKIFLIFLPLLFTNCLLSLLLQLFTFRR